MKRWIWLVGVPYVVFSSTWSEVSLCKEIYPKEHWGKKCYGLDYTQHTEYRFGEIRCSTLEFCQDLAEALNQAQERRLKGNPYDSLTREQAIDLLKDKDFIIQGNNRFKKAGKKASDETNKELFGESQ